MVSLPGLSPAYGHKKSKNKQKNKKKFHNSWMNYRHFYFNDKIYLEKQKIKIKKIPPMHEYAHIYFLK